MKEITENILVGIGVLVVLRLVVWAIFSGYYAAKDRKGIFRTFIHF